MFHRFAIAVAVLFSAGLASWVWFHPDPPYAGAADQRAQFLSEHTWTMDRVWFGGFSGFDLYDDGSRFVAVTDSGIVVTGQLIRSQELITEVEMSSASLLLNKKGDPVSAPRDDAEGVALSENSTFHVSFERAHRVWAYSAPDAPARQPGYREGWRALSENGGMEALAVDDAGTLWAVAEKTGRDSKWSLVFTREEAGDWRQPYVLPLSAGFRPVGADFGPDGRLYLLERAVYPFGFMSRVRALSLRPEGISDIETVLQTRLRRHDNLEGLAVWQDDQGRTRLTMISDDNFFPVQRTEIVEYVLR